MKSPDEHIVAKSWTRRVARQVEQEMYRIERESRFLSGIINGVIAGAAVGLVAWLVTSFQEGDLLLFACLGSSAASVVFAPLSRNNSLRTIVASYLAASIVCFLLYPIHEHELIPVTWQCLLAVALPVTLMRWADTMHPAAIGFALSFIIYDRDMQSIVMLLLAILGLLTIVKILAYAYLEDLRFSDFGREFRRSFYGKEITVTISDAAPEAADQTNQDAA